VAVASFHLLRFPAAGAARQLARLPSDRRALRRVAGARFARLLGTGRGRRMGASADLRRWAVFAVWEDAGDLERFLHHHPLPERWAGAEERYDLVLEPMGAHGSWDGTDPTAGASATGGPGPVAVLTRATVRWRKVPAFLAAVPDVERSMDVADGLLAALGMGEWPVGRQATFSLWRDSPSVGSFAYRTPDHTTVVERTRAEGWYGEEWFARFRPRHSSGTWDGLDPLDRAG
jgi:hypothetical protein